MDRSKARMWHAACRIQRDTKTVFNEGERPYGTCQNATGHLERLSEQPMDSKLDGEKGWEWLLLFQVL